MAMSKKASESDYSVILDTSFMIRLLKNDDPLHANAMGYYRYFLENDIPMFFSSISIAEYCVKGELEDLPFQTLRIIPFSVQHAPVAGKFAAFLFDSNDQSWRKQGGRKIIPNDTKLFAQGALEPTVKYFVTADTASNNPIQLLRDALLMDLEHLDIHTTHAHRFGILDI